MIFWGGSFLRLSPPSPAGLDKARLGGGVAPADVKNKIRGVCNKLINLRFFNLFNFSILNLQFAKNKNTINPPIRCRGTYNYQSKEINPY